MYKMSDVLANSLVLSVFARLSLITETIYYRNLLVQRDERDFITAHKQTHMTFALCLIKCDYQSVENTLKSIRNVKGVIESHATSGPYDAILKVKADSQDELRSIVKNIGTISGVFAILTAIVYNIK